MQYILTQEELDALVPRVDLVERDAYLEVARLLVLKHSKTTCIHDRPRHHGRAGGYCDDCPLSDVLLRGSTNRLCTLPKNYSK